MNRNKFYLYFLLGLLSFASCRSTKYVPDGAYLLNKTTVKVDRKGIDKTVMQNYIRPRPNYKLFGLWRVQLGLYNLSGADTTKWRNRWLRNLGTPPVLYDEAAALRTARNMEIGLSNMGYMYSSVDIKKKFSKKKVNLVFDIHSATPYRIREMRMDIEDDTIKKVLAGDTASFVMKKGELFNSDAIDAYREALVERLRQHGYYRFTKEYVYFMADSALNSHEVDLTLLIHPYKGGKHVLNGDTLVSKVHPRHKVDQIYFITDYDFLGRQNGYVQREGFIDSLKSKSVKYKNINIYSEGERRKIRPDVLSDNCFIRPGELYDERRVDLTYNALIALSSVKSANIRFVERREGDELLLDCVIVLSFTLSQSFSTNAEGTVTSGNLGFAGSFNWQHRNLFKGSEVVNFKLRGAYESIGSNLSDLIDDSYYEFGAEASVTIPKFLFPFLKSDLRRSVNASTAVGVSFDMQSRPEYQRRIATTSYTYKWRKRQKSRYSFDLLNLSYVYLPWVSDAFKEDFLNNNSYLRYSYENHFILSSGLNYSYNSSLTGGHNRNAHTFRVGFESAGNFLWSMSKLFHTAKNDDKYTLFKLRYEQYVRANFDFAKQLYIDERNSLAFHIGMGVAVPYGNSLMVPFEKRFFSGGANSVRGWSIRRLGPGSFKGETDRIDYVNQSGDIRLDLSAEYRSKLFWKFQLAAFVDAGNVWTIHKYESQPGGDFRWDRFYKEIAASYGLGLRLDFDFFLIRFDFGMKAYNPQQGEKSWPLIAPNITRDMALHFAIGYPF